MTEAPWKATWIGPVEPEELPARQRPGYQLAGGVQIDGELAGATLRATAHGLYEAFVNDTPVGDLELTPGWTAYRQRLQVHTFDVTDLVAVGDNVVGVLLTDGWWRGQNSVSRRVDDYGSTTEVLLQLEVMLTTGEVLTLGTDATWRATTADDVTAVVVHSDLERIGGFECSDDRINKLHDIAVWSFRDNACDLPTDCPTRERAGWTGDWQIFVETAAFLYDVGEFSRRWLRDLAAEQRPDGKVTSLVPESHPGDDRPPFHWPLIEGSAGWGDAAVHVPWITYRTTGDAQVLADQWESAKAWVDFAARAAATGRHESRTARSADPAPHEQFLWDSGWHFGEWLEAGESLDDTIAAAMVADHGAVATAYLHRSASQLAAIARILGKDTDAEHYTTLAVDVADAWRTEFLAADGSTTPDTQATYARALTFGRIPDELRAASADRLVQLIRDAGNHLTTGFLATPFLLPVLADTGHLDVAYDLLFQDTEPSWLVMVDRGATSVWEEWGGIDADGVPHASLNHYSKGAVITFLHQHVAGLQAIEPGYRRFRVAPQPGGGIEWAAAHHRSPHGLIEVHWDRDDDGHRLAITVPAGTEAEVLDRAGEVRSLSSGRHAVRI